MDLFDMVPDNFFSLLSSKNKRLYLAAILQTFKVYETGSILGIDKCNSSAISFIFAGHNKALAHLI